MRALITTTLLWGCSQTPLPDDDDDDNSIIDVDDTAKDSGSDTASDTIPDPPDPFALTIAGSYSGNLYFDTPTCTNPLGSKNFSVFWRDSTGTHVFVLVAQMLGTLQGEGVYDETAVTIKLQEEAGGSGGYFSSSTGDTVSLTLAHMEDGAAWGEYSFTGLDGGALSATPMPVPIWCPSITQ